MATLYFARLAFLVVLLLVAGTLTALAITGDREKK
jgi:hypothetical protein